MQRTELRGRVLRLPAGISPDGLVEPGDDIAAAEGFSMKSSAPLLIAPTAIAISPCPEIMKIGAG